MVTLRCVTHKSNTSKWHVRTALAAGCWIRTEHSCCIFCCFHSKSPPTMTGASLRDRDLDLVGEWTHTRLHTLCCSVHKDRESIKGCWGGKRWWVWWPEWTLMTGSHWWLWSLRAAAWISACFQAALQNGCQSLPFPPPSFSLRSLSLRSITQRRWWKTATRAEGEDGPVFFHPLRALLIFSHPWGRTHCQRQQVHQVSMSVARFSELSCWWSMMAVVSRGLTWSTCRARFDHRGCATSLSHAFSPIYASRGRTCCWQVRRNIQLLL